MQAISYSEARQNLATIMNGVAEDFSPLTLDGGRMSKVCHSLSRNQQSIFEKKPIPFSQSVNN